MEAIPSPELPLALLLSVSGCSACVFVVFTEK